MKIRALKISLLFFLYITPYIVALQPNSSEIQLARPSPFNRSVDIEQRLKEIADKLDALPDQIQDGVRNVANVVTRDVLDQVAYYYAGPMLCGTIGAGLFAYAVGRKESGVNKKTIALLGTSAAWFTLAAMMFARPDLFGNERHNH